MSLHSTNEKSFTDVHMVSTSFVKRQLVVRRLELRVKLHSNSISVFFKKTQPDTNLRSGIKVQWSSALFLSVP